MGCFVVVIKGKWERKKGILIRIFRREEYYVSDD